jgi:hypothetical protein
MKKIITLLFALSLLLLLVQATTTLAHEVHECHWESGRAFGQHVADHAQSEELGAEHNPGHHQGYSICVP